MGRFMKKGGEAKFFFMSGLKSVIFVIVLALIVNLSVTSKVHAHAALKFLILPFDIQGNGDISGVRREIMNTLAYRFQEEGAKIVGIDIIKRYILKDGIRIFDEKKAAEIGHKAGADFAVLGTVKSFKHAISVEWRVFDIYSERNTSFFFKSDEDKEILLADLKKQVSAAYGTAVTTVKKRPLKKGGNISEIVITGSHRIDEDAILKRVTSGVGKPYSTDDVREDIKSIYAMGYFDDVRAELIDTTSGKRLTYLVRERPLIKRIEIIGNKEVSKDRIREVITVKQNTILDKVILKENAEKIRVLYEGKGYYLARVGYHIDVEGGWAVVSFKIEEGDEVKVRRIAIIGNERFSDWTIKRVMKTGVYSLFSFITDSGKFNEFVFQSDLDSIRELYYNRGYIHAEILDHRVLLSDDKRWFYITIAIKEGERYKVGKIDIKGDMLKTKQELMKEVELTTGDVFNKGVLGKDLDRIRAIYGDKGYANVKITPVTRVDEKKRSVDITLNIKKGLPVYIEHIDISGNTKTRDKVIRRELDVDEGKLYSLTGIKRSRNNLKRLGYFTDVAISQRPGSSKDKISLDVKVTERPTGQLSAGFGYSSVDKIIGRASISQDNFAGTGIKLKLSGDASATSNTYEASITEPWLMDKPISAGIDLFKTSRDFPDFARDSKGLNLRFGFQVYERETRAYLSFKDEEVEVTKVSDAASLIIKEQEGKRETRSVKGLIRRDTRDDFFLPSEGSVASLSLEYAGGPLGGDNDFVKSLVNAVKFFPMPKRTTLALHGNMGYIFGFKNQPVPIYERFFPGGIDSLRGFRTREVGPRDSVTGEFIGGDKEIIFNAEFLFPIGGAQGLRGLLFFDAGNAYLGKIDLNNFRRSAGVGVRWLSPVGPLRLEWGYNLKKREGEKSSQFEFSMGSPF